MGNGQSNSPVHCVQRLDSFASVSMQALTTLSRISANDVAPIIRDGDDETGFTCATSLNNINSICSDYSLCKKYDVVISYARPSITDIEFAHEIAQKLELGGLAIWINTNRFENGQAHLSFADVINSSPIVIICLSESYENCVHCRDETKRAVAQECPIVIVNLMQRYRVSDILQLCPAAHVVDFATGNTPSNIQRLLCKVLDVKASLLERGNLDTEDIVQHVKFSLQSYEQVVTGVQLRQPCEYYVTLGGVARSEDGTLLVSDLLNRRIKRITPPLRHDTDAVLGLPDESIGSETVFEDLGETEFGALRILEYLSLRLFPTEKISLVALVSSNRHVCLVDLDRRAVICKTVLDKSRSQANGSCVVELSDGHILVGFVGQTRLHVIEYERESLGFSVHGRSVAVPLNGELRCLSYNALLNQTACAVAQGCNATSISVSHSITDPMSISSTQPISRFELRVAGVVDQLYQTDHSLVILHLTASRSPSSVCVKSGALLVYTDTGSLVYRCEDSMPARIVCASVSAVETFEQSITSIVINFWSDDLVLRRIILLQSLM